MGAGKTKTTKDKTKLPGYLDKAYKGLVKAGAAEAASPMKQYTGARTAGFTPDQYSGFDLIRNAQGMGLPYINEASGLYGDVAGADFSGTRGSTIDYGGLWDAGQGITDSLDWGAVPYDTTNYSGINAGAQAVMPGVDKYNSATLGAYMDPYIESVINPTLERLNRENAKQISGLKGSGIAMGLAPGLGDRLGLAASDLAGQQSLGRDQTISNLYSQGFQNAQQQLSNQQQLQLQGGTSDQQRMLEAAGLIQSGNQTDANRILQQLTSQGQLGQQDMDRLLQVQTLAQQGRQEDANRLLQSIVSEQQGNLSAAQGVAGLGQQAQDMTYQGIDYLMNAGQMQQQLGQQQLDQTYQDWMDRNNYSKDQIDWLANLIYGSPGANATTQTTQTPGPSLISQLTGLATAGVGAARSWGSSRGGPIKRDLGGPIIDVSRFQVPQIDLGGAPSGPGVHAGGETYINALDPLRPRDLGHTGARKTQLPKDIRRIFKNIGKGGLGGGGDKSIAYGSDEWAERTGGPGATIWRDLLGGGGKKKGKKKAIGGGLLPDATEPLPGTPEYDVLLRSKLSGEGPSVTPIDDEVFVEEEVDLGGGPTSSPARTAGGLSRMGRFMRDLDPLVPIGLGIAAGESPYPLQNIGSGASTGLQLAQQLYQSELDDKPLIDDNGPTVRYWSAENGWEDSGIPSARWAAATTSSSTGTEKERFMEGKYGPDWRKNPAAVSEFSELLKTPDTLIDMKGAGAFATENAKGLSERMFQVMDEATNAASLTSTYGQIATLLSDPDVYTGTGGETISSLKKMGETLFGLDVEGAAAGEVATQIKNAAIGKMREEVLGPGVMSNADRQILESIFPGLSTSAEGIQLAYEIQKINAAGAQDKARKLQEIMDASGGELTPQGWFQFQNWVQANPFFTPEVVREAQTRAKAAAVQNSPGAGLPSVDDVKKKWGLD